MIRETPGSSRTLVFSTSSVFNFHYPLAKHNYLDSILGLALTNTQAGQH